MSLADYLPAISTALLNPVAGIAQLAATFLGGKLNVAPTVEAVTQKLSGMSPEEMVKFKDLDVQLQEHLSDNGIRLVELEQQLQLGQIETNKIEAASNRGNPWLDFFIAGWRPYLGWVGGLGIGYQFLLRPLLNGATWMLIGTNAFPTLEVQDLIALVTMLLGSATLRSWDKKNGNGTGA